MTSRSDILSQLEKQILPLQGLRKLPGDNNVRIDCSAMESAFPNGVFPVGCMHEFITHTPQDGASTNGFVAAILGKLLKQGGICLWISTSRTLFAAALVSFNVNPEQIIFIDVKNERDVLYATEEALKCNKLIAVLAEIKNLSFKESRRFQLAAEQSRVTGFIIRHGLRTTNTIACVSRWHITSLPSMSAGMPGVGFPRWKVELQKIRSGTPGSWIMEWSAGNFNVIQQDEKVIVLYEGLKQIG
ncbi:Error-prone repair protein ImuA [Panacibacter sp. DH6]|uniref:Error-prone repair protein ImuA n=1 Tax=Panacibacter microcysteis TaxID=2793269 RepID=A0A931GTR3_9BACT|nr:Error-prone repair protein ImuA [Panacibacter microcysteis]MBG9374620.1 Error-prone repair protein ImuA [Panacibacter microcysteis]